jgi:S-formylglutathione hydrolase
MVFPDTSPRDVECEGIKDSWDFGESAGFYVDATVDKYSKHFNMYSYVAHELPEVVKNHFHINTKRSAITGFSMGGLGAINIALKNPGQFKSVSAFSPISSMTDTHWGKKASEGFLGSVEAGKAYDPATLIQSYEGLKIPMLIDYGLADKWQEENLKTPSFISACHSAKYPVEEKKRDGYDHSYYYVASFIGEHLDFHARALFAPSNE